MEGDPVFKLTIALAWVVTLYAARIGLSDPPASAPADNAAPIRVLYVEGLPRWEFRYIRQELARDPHIRLSTCQISGDSDALEGENPPAKRLEVFNPRGTVDVVILGDVDPRQLADAQMQALVDFVKGGGGMAFIAGEHFNPSAYEKTPLEALLPVSPSPAKRADKPTSKPFHLQLTNSGQRSPLLRLDDDEAKSQRMIETGLPALWWFRDDVEEKADAKVLAQHPTAMGQGNRPIPLIVTRQFGQGRVEFIGIDSTWRWRAYAKSDVFFTFWKAQLRYLAQK